MRRPSRSLLLYLIVGLIGGVLNVVVVASLYSSAGVPLPDGVSLALLFGFGAVPLLISYHARLVGPAIGYLGLLAALVVAEYRTPAPDVGELGGNTVVYGQIYVTGYLANVDVVIALSIVVAVVELGVRSGYGLGGGSVRNAPVAPFSAVEIAWLAGGSGVVFGASIFFVATDQLVGSTLAHVGIGVVAGLVVAIPLACLLFRGLVVPVFLLGWTAYGTLSNLLGTISGGFFGFLLVDVGAMCLVAVLEYVVRFRLLDGTVARKFYSSS